ncbi:MAG: hypothetical protein V5A30_02215 [Haloarculaceae archaeon]
MGPLERLRSWLARLLGGRDESTDETQEGNGSDAPEGGGLDPSGATETRATGQDDAVEALRETRRDRDGAGERDPATDTDDRHPATDTDTDDRHPATDTGGRDGG